MDFTYFASFGKYCSLRKQFNHVILIFRVVLLARAPCEVKSGAATPAAWRKSYRTLSFSVHLEKLQARPAGVAGGYLLFVSFALSDAGVAQAHH
ncbi:hypothetical protein [Tritonibacter aquimaris]|uniref:hypothetical protein n=1 Tax=Tritonibacter aquimaris TaxID=2663379 RepID=UPI0018861C73|nr:hypothetical protein [Tritonibacter aquimaris]